MTIHTSDPFATPEEARSVVRRLRGRLAAPVTLWTAYAPDGTPAGLTVSSTMVVDGEPGRLLGVVDEESTLYEALRGSGRFAVGVLRASDRRVADTFAGVVPVPGGPFQAGAWRRTEYGPLPEGIDTWALCDVDEVGALGWGVLVRATIATVNVGGEDPGLIHYRGRYANGPAGGPDQNG